MGYLFKKFTARNWIAIFAIVLLTLVQVYFTMAVVSCVNELMSVVQRGIVDEIWKNGFWMILSALLLAELLWTIYNAFSWNPEFFFTLGFGVLLFLWAVLVLRKFLRIEKQHSGERINVDTFHFLRNSSDIYAKRLLNSIALFFGALSVYFGSELSFYIFGNSKSAELLENISTNII
jgi:hypothetical protein